MDFALEKLYADERSIMRDLAVIRKDVPVFTLTDLSRNISSVVLLQRFNQSTVSLILRMKEDIETNSVRVYNRQYVDDSGELLSWADDLIKRFIEEDSMMLSLGYRRRGFPFLEYYRHTNEEDILVHRNYHGVFIHGVFIKKGSARRKKSNKDRPIYYSVISFEKNYGDLESLSSMNEILKDAVIESKRFRKEHPRKRESL